MTIPPIHPPAQVLSLQQARIRRLAARYLALDLLVELAGHLAEAGRLADLDALVAAVATAWGSEATHAERAEAVDVIDGLIRAVAA